jgi:chromate transporter
LTDEQFEHAIAATNLLPGPGSTQLAIYCAWRLRGWRGAVLGGLCFILPGLVLILALSVAFLSGSPPAWIRGAGAGAGAAVAAVAVRAGYGVAAPIYRRAAASGHGRRLARVLVYGLAGGAGAALVGPWLVLVLLACGAIELGAGSWPLAGSFAAVPHIVGWPVRVLAWLRGGAPGRVLHAFQLAAVGSAATTDPGGAAALAWTAFKVGALAFGGGFVIVPLMQSDAVGTYHWMTHAQFLDAVALGQVTPGPVTQTVAAVGYSAAGLAGGLLAALIAFAPSFSFILIGASRFERLLADGRVRAFLDGAAPAAAGAIVGAGVPLATALTEGWQYAILAAAAVALFVLRRGVVGTLLIAGLAGTLAGLLGAAIPS